MLVIYLNPDFSSSGYTKQFLDLLYTFLFPFHSLLTSLDKESQQSFVYLILLNLSYALALFLAKFAYHGLLKLKFSLYITEIVAPDIVIYLVCNFLELSSIEYYTQTLGFFVTVSLCASLCIGAPMVIVYDQEPYKHAFLLYTGLKEIRKEW